MNATALLGHLDAALDALRAAQHERALSLVLDVYEAHHFTSELAAILRRVDEADGGALDDLAALLLTLKARVRAEAPLVEEPPAPSAPLDLSLDLSLSDFFEEMSLEEPSRRPEPPTPGSSQRQLIQSARLTAQPGFAEESDVLSFDDLDLDLDVLEDQGDALLEGIWPDEHDLEELEPLMLEHLEEAPDALGEGDGLGSISGHSETRDELDGFDIFAPADSPESERESIVIEEGEGDEDEPKPSLPRPSSLKGLKPLSPPPSYHEAQRSPRLEFSFDLEESDAQQTPGVALSDQEDDSTIQPVESDGVDLIEPIDEDDDLFDDLFDFSVDYEPDLPRSSTRPSSPSDPATVAMSPEALPRLTASPDQAQQEEPVTRQVDEWMLLEELGGEAFASSAELPAPSRASSTPAVKRDQLINPLSNDPSQREQSKDAWDFDAGPASMPGLDDDWLKDHAERPAPEQPSQRDVHNDATAIPGLNTSNSDYPFNPYQSAVGARSSPPPAGRGSASSSLGRTREQRQPSLAPSQSGLSGLPPRLKETREQVEGGSDEDDFDFDLGLSAPHVREAGAGMDYAARAERDGPASPSPAPPNAARPSATLFGAPLASSGKEHGGDEPQVLVTPSSQPITAEHQDISEDEFFALAESIAAEKSSTSEANAISGSGELFRPYRGEPMMRGEPSRGRLATIPHPSIKAPSNPFAQQTPTGVRAALVEESSQVSFSLEEVEDDELDVERDPAEQLASAQRAYEEGRFEDAMDATTALLNGPLATRARALLDAIERELERLQLERIGSLQGTPTLSVRADELSTLALDHRAGFLISQIDGVMTFEDILDLSAMPRLETMVVLVDLLEREIIRTA